jgi:hypothetical protein
MKAGNGAGLACRACEQPFSNLAVRNECRHCGYVNLLIPDVKNQFEWLSSEYASGSVASLFSVQFTRARELVAKDLAAATALLIRSMVQRESLYEYERSATSRSTFRESRVALFNFAVQLLYLLICQQGGVRLRSLPAITDSFDDRDELWRRVRDAALLARLRMKADADEATFTVTGDTLVESLAEAVKIAAETQENSHVVEKKFRNRYPVLEEPELFAMQKAVLGYSAQECTKLIANNFARLREQTAVQDCGPIVIANMGSITEATRTLLEVLSLNLQRVLRFQYPYYFDLGTLRRGPAPADLPLEAIALNWTSYYPCYEAHTEDGNGVILFSKHAWVNALTYMLASRSAMAAELEKRAKKMSTPEAALVRGLRTKSIWPPRNPN